MKTSSLFCLAIFFDLVLCIGCKTAHKDNLNQLKMINSQTLNKPPSWLVKVSVVPQWYHHFSNIWDPLEYRKGAMICPGAVIASGVILTAGHCVLKTVQSKAIQHTLTNTFNTITNNQQTEKTYNVRSDQLDYRISTAIFYDNDKYILMEITKIVHLGKGSDGALLFYSNDDLEKKLKQKNLSKPEPITIFPHAQLPRPDLNPTISIYGSGLTYFKKSIPLISSGIHHAKINPITSTDLISIPLYNNSSAMNKNIRQVTHEPDSYLYLNDNSLDQYFKLNKDYLYSVELSKYSQGECSGDSGSPIIVNYNNHHYLLGLLVSGRSTSEFYNSIVNKESNDPSITGKEVINFCGDSAYFIYLQAYLQTINSLINNKQN